MVCLDKNAYESNGMDVINQNIPTMAKIVLEKAPILFAIPCIPN